VDIPIGLFFGPPTIEELAERPEFDGPRWATMKLAAGELADSPDAVPTAAQARYWFIEQYLGASALYHVAAVFGIDGPLDVPALTAALEALHERHEALRLSIVDTTDGPRQVLSAYNGMELKIVDGQSPTEVFRAEAARPFDLAAAPLVRFVLVRTGDEAWQLGLIGQHIAVDAAALDVIMRELVVLYPAILKTFVENGLMIGQFHPLPPVEGGLWTKDFRPLRCPVPLLAIRHMVPTDLPFLTRDRRLLDGYYRVFGDDLPPRQRVEFGHALAMVSAPAASHMGEDRGSRWH